MPLPTLSGKIHYDAEQAIKMVHDATERLKQDHQNLSATVRALPDPRGPLTTAQTTQVQQTLASGNQLIQQVQGFPMIANIPTTDPKVAGVLWNDSGTVKVSVG